MSSGASARLLDSFPVIRSRNAEEVRDAVIRFYGARGFNLPHGAEGFDVRANHWQSQNIGLSYCSYGAQVQLDFADATFFRQQIGLHGGANVKFTRNSQQVTSDETLVVPPDRSINVDFGPGFEQVVLRISPDALMSKLTALIDAVPRSPLVFDPTKFGDRAAVDSLRRMVMFFASELDSAGTSGMPLLALAELEQALIVSFLSSNPNNYTALIYRHDRPAASWQVRRAVEFIEAHWDKPITMEALARVTSASARSIFYHFKQSRGQSPMAYVKEVRLRHARQMLMSTDTGASVTETALACGFNNLGHFAGDYLQRFGERPSDTIKRAKGSSVCSHL